MEFNTVTDTNGQTVSLFIQTKISKNICNTAWEFHRNTIAPWEESFTRAGITGTTNNCMIRIMSLNIQHFVIWCWWLNDLLQVTWIANTWKFEKLYRRCRLLLQRVQKITSIDWTLLIKTEYISVIIEFPTYGLHRILW